MTSRYQEGFCAGYRKALVDHELAETTPRSPLASLPGWDIAERVVADEDFRRAFDLLPKYRGRDSDRAKSEWRDTVGEGRT